MSTMLLDVYIYRVRVYNSRMFISYLVFPRIKQSLHIGNTLYGIIFGGRSKVRPVAALT